MSVHPHNLKILYSSAQVSCVLRPPSFTRFSRSRLSVWVGLMHIDTSSQRALSLLDKSSVLIAEHYHLNYYFPATFKLFPNYFSRQMPAAESGSRRCGAWEQVMELSMACRLATSVQVAMHLADNVQLKQ